MNAKELLDRLRKTTRQFRRKVQETESECWEWTGGLSEDGYGYFYLGSKRYRAHRYSYEFYNGCIRDGLVVMHTCDNRRCVNPDHLVVGTQAENVADCIEKGRKNALKGEAQGRAKLTAADVIALRIRHHQKPLIWTEVEAEASRLDVSPRAIDKVLKGQSWKSVVIPPHGTVGNGSDCNTGSTPS